MRLGDEAATAALGRRIGGLLAVGDVVALIGDLGAGKSVLARGIARGVGIEGRVPSPTFVVVALYPDARVPFAHADLYRLDDPDELGQLGLEDVFGGPWASVIEWADRFPDVLPADRLELRLTIDGEARDVALTAGGPRSRAVLTTLSEGVGG